MQNFLNQNEQYIKEFKVDFSPKEIDEFFNLNFYFQNSLRALIIFEKYDTTVKGVKFNININLVSKNLINENGKYTFDLTHFFKHNNGLGTLDVFKVSYLSSEISEIIDHIIEYNEETKQLYQPDMYIKLNYPSVKHKIIFNDNIKNLRNFTLKITCYTLNLDFRKEVLKLN